ncbi:MAG: lipocalin-like domain-containing protein [Pseudomonadota bacterium]
MRGETEHRTTGPRRAAFERLTRLLALSLALTLSAVCGTIAQAQPTPAEIARAAADGLIDASLDAAFERPAGPWTLTLPQDHGAHPEARTESWTLAAHLTTEAGEALGIQFALTRFGVRTLAEVGDDPWALRALHRAHVIVTRGAEGRLMAEERYSRGALDVAGHDPRAGTVWLEDWSIGFASPGATPAPMVLSATVEGTPLTLTLTPQHEALAAGGGDAPFRGYALSRLAVEGTLGTGAEAKPLAGLAWLDHLWGDLPLPGGPVAYDRLVLHLDDGSDLSVVRTRRSDGRGEATVDALMIEGAATATPSITMNATDTWTPSGSEIAYPTAWRIEGPTLDLRLTPVIENQRPAFAVPLWSGMIRVDGRRDGVAVTGTGTLQLTGYEDP